MSFFFSLTLVVKLQYTKWYYTQRLLFSKYEADLSADRYLPITRTVNSPINIDDLAQPVGELSLHADASGSDEMHTDQDPNGNHVGPLVVRRQLPK